MLADSFGDPWYFGADPDLWKSIQIRHLSSLILRKRKQKKFFIFFSYNLPTQHLQPKNIIFWKGKRKEKREGSGSGSGSVPLTNGSGSGRPKNMRILRIRIRIPNTACMSKLFPLSWSTISWKMRSTHFWTNSGTCSNQLPFPIPSVHSAKSVRTRSGNTVFKDKSMNIHANNTNIVRFQSGSQSRVTCECYRKNDPYKEGAWNNALCYISE
jgi:hypothetical protein